MVKMVICGDGGEIGREVVLEMVDYVEGVGGC